MRFINPKKIEHNLKNFFNLSDEFLLKRRAKRYLKKNTEREIRVLREIVDYNKASIDIGVYRGIYSYFLSELTTFVYAFEANPLLHEKLLSSFRNQRNVKIENVAVSSKTGTTDLRIPLRDINADFDPEQKYRLGTATIHTQNNLENKEYETISNIKKITLDEYKFEHEIGFLKIDVEGHELDVIRGANSFLKQHNPVMLIEIEKRHAGQSHFKIIEEIINIGYECYYVDDKFNIQNFEFNQKVRNNNFIFKPQK